MFVTVILAFITVLALIIGLAYGLKFLKDKSRSTQWWGAKNIKLLETLHVDTKRKVILIACGDQAHLIFSGPTNEFLIQSTPLPLSENPMNTQDADRA